jgi:hypothetical protein
MRYVENWDERQKHFVAWWKGLKLEKPLMKVIARRKEPVEGLEIINEPSTPEEVHPLQKQCEQLNCSLYHLDGPGAVRHVDALMEIKDLRALQWSPGAGQPDGGSEKWYPIYEKVRSANKSLWISISDGRIEDWIASAKKLIKNFGTDGLYLLFPVMEEQEAARLIGEIEQC